MNIRYRLRTYCFTFFFLGIFSYFGYQLFHGERGLMALVQLSSRVRHLEESLDSLRSKRIQLEHHVSLLKSDSLDLDMLDEQTRHVLGVASPEELIYYIE